MNRSPHRLSKHLQGAAGTLAATPKAYNADADVTGSGKKEKSEKKKDKKEKKDKKRDAEEANG